MKRSVFLLASLALCSALYAQSGESLFSREQVLDIFAQYNPSVLEKARQSEDYQALLDGFVQAFQIPDTPENRFNAIAAARNFENSIRLQALAESYIEKVTWARMSGQDYSGMRTLYHQDLKDVMSDIWAVSLQMRNWQFEQTKKALKDVRRADISAADKAAREQAFKMQIQLLKQEIRSLKKNAGALVLDSVEKQQAQTELQVAQRLGAQTQELSAAQASNLQIKTNHKKPVAK